MLPSLSRTSVVLAVAALLACSDSTDPDRTAGPPARIEQLIAPTTATAGTVVMVAVMVSDRHGNPVEGSEVRWIAADGSGVVATPNNLTNADGEAHADWFLGATPKTYTLSAHALQGTGTSKTSVAVTTFTIVATAPAGTRAIAP